MRFRPLHRGFGAEVLDVNLLADLSPAEVDQVRRAFDEYQLLLIRNERRIPPERHVEIAHWFASGDEVTDGEPWTTMDNENTSGSMRLRFHSDHTYTDAPIKIISLHALELPKSGAATSFVSGVHGWATLPPDRQALLAGMTARHRHRLLSLGDTELPEFRADHPVCLSHPRTGKPVLFITEWHADLIYGLDHDESDRLLRELVEHLYAPERVYIHRWRLHDFVIWDNLALQHARTEEAHRAEGHRLLQRVALNDATFSDLIERARAQERARQLQGT